jgi:hypothetical protein
MLRNNVVYGGISIGVIFLAVYSYFQLQEGTDVTVQENTIENKLLAIFTLANLTMLYTQQNRNNDEIFITDALVSIYNRNAVDKCKLDTLLEFSPSFKIILEDDTNMGREGGYYASRQSLTLPLMSYKQDKMIFSQMLSHELKHAIDAFNNFNNGVCVQSKNGISYGSPEIHGTTPTDCHFDFTDQSRVDNLIAEDFKRIKHLFALAQMDTHKLNKAEKEELKMLDKLIKAYNYKHSWRMLDYNGQAPDPERVEVFKQHYVYDKKTSLYHAKSSLSTYYTPYTIIGTTYNFQTYIFKYSEQYNYALVALSLIKDSSIKNLRFDLLINLLLAFGEVVRQKYDENVFVLEVPAYVENVLAKYSHTVKLPGETNYTSLRGWLFPRIHAHDKARASKEYDTCLQRNVYRG